MTYRIRFTPEAEDDLLKLYRFMLERDATDWTLAERALAAIRAAMVTLEQFPFTCRKASIDSPFLLELLIPFGGSGDVALFEIEDAETGTILTVRHQRESDYHRSDAAAPSSPRYRVAKKAGIHVGRVAVRTSEPSRLARTSGPKRSRNRT